MYCLNMKGFPCINIFLQVFNLHYEFCTSLHCVLWLTELSIKLIVNYQYIFLLKSPIYCNCKENSNQFLFFFLPQKKV